MNRLLIKLGAALCVLLFSAGTTLAANDKLVQYSTIGALFQRMYDGEMTVGQLRQHGGFGLGTVNGLDGELVVLGGQFYQVKADGTVHVLPDEARTPFAAVTDFAPDETHQTADSLDYAKARESVDQWIPTRNLFYAIRIEGVFQRVTARSVAAQTRPYPALTEIVKKQSVFEFKDTPGTMVGFRVPAYAGSLNVAGFHLHFLTADRKGGGHVLDFVLQDGSIAIDGLPELLLILPRTETFERLDLSPASPDSLKSVEGPH